MVAVRARGFSFVELVVTVAVLFAVCAAVLPLLVRTPRTFDARTEMADMQQRLRVAADTLFDRIESAGAGAYAGTAAGPLARSFVAIVPYRMAGTTRDPPGSYKTDTITLFSVPRAAAVPSAATYWLKADASTATYQLMVADDSGNTDVPVADNIVSLAFDYFGDPQPPLLQQPPAAAGPWMTTYGPVPGVMAVAPFAAGENCVFAHGETMPQPRLAALADPGTAPVKLAASDFSDGPWCPHAGDPNRWDADLLRIRVVAVTMRVQAAVAALRGPAGVLFAHGGTSRSADRWVPDQEIRFQVAPRNLNIGR